MDLATLKSLSSELEKISAGTPPKLPAAASDMAKAFFGGVKKTDALKSIVTPSGKNPLLSKLTKTADNGLVEVAGLGALAAPAVDNMVAKLRARRAGEKNLEGHELDKYRLIKEKYHDPIEVGGLGVLAAPYIHKRLTTGKW